MRIRFLTLANYRKLKDQKLSLAGGNVVISGRNGTGKTTVANAITDVLANTAITGEKDYSPKTAGTHKLNHVVTMTIEDDQGEEMTLAKDFHEVWKKKRGSQAAEFSGHETTYEINGVPTKKKDYEETVKGICGGDAKFALMLMQVGYFAEVLPMDERRKILVDICGDVSDDEILNLSGIAPLKEYLPVPGTSGRKYSPEEFLQIAKVKRRELNKKLDELPARIDELARTLSGIRADVGELEAELRALNEKKSLAVIQPKDTTLLGIEAAMAGIRAAIEKGRADWTRENTAKTEKQLADLRSREADLLAQVDKLTGQTESKNRQLEKMINEREKCLDEFDKLKAEKWDSASEVCPTCGQVLPADAIKKLRENWLENLAQRKAEINARGKAVSLGNINKAKDEYAQLHQAFCKVSADLDEIKKQKADICNSAPASVYEDSEKYKENAARLAELTAKREALKAGQEDSRPDTSEIDNRISEIHETLARCRAEEKGRQRVEELQAEMKTTSESLDYYEKGIHLCEIFFREKMRSVSEKVSSRFDSVGWKLFKEQINGGLAECCEPLVALDDGTKVEWKSANTAAQINAGLEIIEVLSEHYNKFLPVIVDRAESVNKLRPMPNHQVISMVVSDEELLTVTLKEGE